MEVLTETVKVLVEKIVYCIITPVGRQMGYLIHYKKIVDNLLNEVVDLEDARGVVQRKVEDASYNVEIIDTNVQSWLTRVQGINTEAREFFEEEGQAKLKCFNLKARYQIGKKAHKMGLAVQEFKDKADTFHTVGHRVPIERGTVISTKCFEDFESRKSIFDGVMKALKDDNIRAIGVCGMGGVGKTVLVGKIATHAMKDKLFERIVTVVVSQTPNLKQIQKDIATELRLKFQDEDTDFQKAHLLRERLNKEKILLIIDDIWNKLDLEALGISFGFDHKGSKLLLTSRFRDVLGSYMDTQEIFYVEVLSNDEAKYLFSKIVGDLAENLDLQSLMVELVKECAGLPIAITTVANALKKQTNPNVWKDASRQLKRANPTQIKGMHDQVYGSIKLSYCFLTKEAQFLFLFCSIFEEDEVIPIAFLWRILVGLDFFQDIYTIEEVRNLVHTLVESLKDACLLLEGDGSGTFKMHNVIRDVAIYIADKDEEMLTMRSSDDLEKWSNMRRLKDFIGIALSDVKLGNLPKLECPQLNFIFLDFKDNTSAVPNHFFEGAKELKVLVLSGACFSLPSSLSCLHKLQSLVLYECELEDVAIIGELKNLKALTLSGSNIKRLPIEIGQLTYLQLLDLKGCPELEVIPPNVLSNLKRLEELYMKSSFNQWQVDGESTEINNTRVSELNHLSLLTTLCIHIPNAKILPKALLFEKLKRYEILIGNDWDWDSDDEFEISRMVKLELDRGLQIDDGIKILLKRCEYLDLAPREGIKNIIYEVDKEGFPQLKHLYVRNSTEIQYIINLMGAKYVVFPLLEFLSLDNMINLEKICHDRDQLAMGSFHSLKKFEVSNCDGLRLVFSFTILRCFLQLQEIVIKNCNLVEEVFDIKGENVDEICDTVFTQLRILRISNLPKLKHVWSSDPQAIFTFQNLHEVSVSNCKSLKSLFPVSVAKNLEQLKSLS